LLHQYDSLFATTTELPPRRSCDHVIPLILGATPVHSRPYRYAPALKNEIEKQVKKCSKQELFSTTQVLFPLQSACQEKKMGPKILH
jgi:hypothetical protein